MDKSDDSNSKRIGIPYQESEEPADETDFFILLFRYSVHYKKISPALSFLCPYLSYNDIFARD